jgi:hypothetical protein
MSATTKYLHAPLNMSPVAELIDNPPFPCLLTATVQGMDENGEGFEANVALDGHLNGSLYLKLEQAVELQSSLFIVLRLAPRLDSSLPALRMALHGRVEFINPRPQGAYDVRVAILDYQQL